MFLSFSENFTHVYNIGLYYNFPFCQASMPLLTPPISILTLQTSFLVFFFIIHWVQLVLPTYVWVWAIHWSVVTLPGTIPLEKTDCLCPGSHQLSKVPRSGEEAHEHPFPKLSGLIFTGLVQAATASVLSWVQKTCPVQKIPFPPGSLDLILSAPLSSSPPQFPISQATGKGLWYSCTI